MSLEKNTTTHDKSSNEMIGERLKLVREALNLSQGDVAKLLEKTNSTVSAMELGRSTITLDTLTKLNDSYSINSNYIIFGDPHPMFTNSSTKTQSVRGSYNRTEMDVNHINDPSSGGDPEKEYLKKRIEDLEKQVDEYRRLYQALLDKL